MNRRDQNQSHRKLTSTRALSVVEMICIIGIAAFAAAGICLGYLYYRDSVRRGDDSHLAVTAERAAVLNAAGTGCVVTGCGGKDGCAHIKAGVSTGYFDHADNTVTGEIPKGYNESTKLLLDGAEYEGERGTMVLKIEYDGTDYRLSWVRGR